MKKTQIALKDDVIFAFNNKKIHNLCKIVKILFSFTHKFPSFLEGALWWRRATRIGHPNGQSCWNALGECTSFSDSTFIVIQIPRYYNWRWDIIGNYVFRSFFLLSFTKRPLYWNFVDAIIPGNYNISATPTPILCSQWCTSNR